MARNYFISTSLASFICASAHAQDEVHIYLTNNTILRYQILERISRGQDVSFEENPVLKREYNFLRLAEKSSFFEKEKVKKDEDDFKKVLKRFSLYDLSINLISDLRLSEGYAIHNVSYDFRRNRLRASSFIWDDSRKLGLEFNIQNEGYVPKGFYIEGKIKF